MASSFPISLSLTALFMLAIATPLAHALLFFGTLNVTGQVCCTTTGNCPGAPLVGATSRLVRDIFGNTNTIATDTTDASGFVLIAGGSFNLAPCTLSTCTVRIRLPVAGCATLTSGELVSAPIQVTTVGFPSRRVRSATAGQFSVQP